MSMPSSPSASPSLTSSAERQLRRPGIQLDTDGCLIKRVLKEGHGELPPARGAIVTIHYEAYLSSGPLFDSSVQNNTPLTFKHGQSTVVEAIEMAIPTMRVGEDAEIVSTQRYAYGKNGMPPFVPPNTSITYKVQLISFKIDNVNDYNNFDTLLAKAKNEKDKGNEYFNQQRHKLAMKRYIKGVWLLGDSRYTMALDDTRSKNLKELLIVLYLNLATCNIKLANGRLALTNCEKVMELGGSSAKFYFRMGQAYSLNKQYESAKRCLVQAIRLEPNDVKLREELENIKKMLQ
ncbi:hypothetical protein SAMD00019534_023060 [Acytostelium subglobosum LB1]|uniref:hypothetical protein n=1 Tax=Acytostelium subglobosum LB1 TaxID=1410327 RepID=UPI00064495BF|nr:hypothetical protein SAMD00019534_023060 [Acytostelium subglobosum LB1]GAM19131.1 hypothetical protein SAMD00019534_023060 [Acytostelium subglobosum LB1]|eukprot:XP_012757058.1 hypothetical protein SAMD00019534_023060 [Acytostelium subglobosum LB1]